MIIDERDYYYRVCFYRYEHGAQRVPCYRYFDCLEDARTFARNIDGRVSRVLRTVADIYIYGGGLYG